MTDINFPAATPETVPYRDFVADLAKPGHDMLNEMNADQMHALHMAIGLSGEAAEMAECLLATAGIDVSNAVEELGDLEFYAQGLRDGLGIHRDETMPESYLIESYPIDPKTAISALTIGAGRVLDAVKKWSIYQKPVDRAAVIVGLTSIEIGMAWTRSGICADRDADVIPGNYTKLGKRYKGGRYSNEAAQVRADKQEG